ncbi:MAG TPA: biopolymer transporter ExbD [Verrucomicrobiae bacterium]|nr:biopolymer transporter ExbD [Verrucomicrobiae bacterium]
MKFPRNARIFRGQLDAAPFATVLFLLVIFLMLGSTPGVLLQLPSAGDLPGLDTPNVRVAIDANGRMYYENQGIEEGRLREKLRQAVKESPEQPLTLIIQADKAVTYDALMHLAMLGKDAGISQSWLAVLPGPSVSGP